MVRHGRDEYIHEYFKRFKDIKNRCFNLTLSEKDLADFALAGLRSNYREKLDGSSFYSLNQFQVRALSQEANIKKKKMSTSPIVQIHIFVGGMAQSML